MRRGPVILAPLLAILCLAGAPLLAVAADADPDALFAAGTTALHDGRTNDAIADFEALGDVGVVDPVASFDRGLAYAQRMRAGGEIPGDLGRAAHGFEEARELSADPRLGEDADVALSVVRAEVARRRSQAGDPVQVDQGIPLRRALTRLLPENGWAYGALGMALLLGVALFVRGLTHARRVRIGAAIAISVSAPTLLAFALLALSARDERLHLREGIIVAASARMTDARHVALTSVAPLPEAARVELMESGAGWTRIRWGTLEGFVPSPTVRAIARANDAASR
jgi:hypothetical protein